MLRLSRKFGTRRALGSFLTKIANYELVDSTYLDDFAMTAHQLQNSVTGARHLHLARDDPNCLFNLGFKTTPMDDNGVAHILEHTVLCGSQKFPVRDPFFKMINRSLQTFMNALTGPDYTMYPYSSMNPKDYQNLLQVYTDACFNPLLKHQDFLQEGWRLEHEEVIDDFTPIIFKGVVFNEMKGATDPDRIFYLAQQNNLYPEHTYSYESGGEPLAIPTLTHEKLLQFHRSHYHPANSWCVTYGNMDVRSTLEYLEGEMLEKSRNSVADTSVPLSTRFEAPKTVRAKCMSKGGSLPENMASVSWRWGDVCDATSLFTHNIIAQYLMDGPASPFYKSLIQSGVGAAYSTYAGFADHLRETGFAIGVRGTERHEDLESIVLETLKSVVNDGFDEIRLKSIIHGYELMTRNQTPQFGLNASFSVMPKWQHGANPVELLNVSTSIEGFWARYRENPNFLVDELQRLTLDNPHRVTTVMTPEDGYSEMLVEKEGEMLRSMLESMSKDDIKGVDKQGLELRKYQAQLDDFSMLPTLNPECDISIDNPNSYTLTENNGVTYNIAASTGGLVYMKMVVDLTGEWDSDEIQMLPAYCEYITRTGAGEFDQHAFSIEQNLYTNGLSAIVVPRQDGVSVVFSSHCLHKNLAKMLDLWGLVLNKAKLGDKNLMEVILKENIEGLSSSVQQNGHGFAMRNASSDLTTCAKLNEQLAGLEQLAYLKDAKASSAARLVRDLHERLVEAPKKVFVTSSQTEPTVEAWTSANASTTSGNPFTYETILNANKNRRHYTLEGSQVNYVSYAIPVPNRADHAKLKILSHLVAAKFLHPMIRERGGAYGSGLVAPDVGSDYSTLRFFSYRDPANLDTLAVFKQSILWLIKEPPSVGHNWGDLPQWGATELSEAKLRAFQTVDAPLAVSVLGSSEIVHGLSLEERNQYRRQLLEVTEEDIMSVAQQYLVPCLDGFDDGYLQGVCVIGPTEFSLKTNEKWEMSTI